MNQLTAVSFFTGVAMFDLGFMAAGYRITHQIEFDTYCQKVLHARGNLFNHPSVYGDVRDCGIGRKYQLHSADVFFGGFPCQPFSQAGKRQGKDDNRNMWSEFARLIGEYKPRAVVLENVPAILAAYRTAKIYPTKSKHGITRFRRGVSRKHPPYAAKVLYDLAQMGYVCSWGIISAADAGLPHQRDRWWCVGILGDASSKRQHQPSAIEKSDTDKTRDASPCEQSGAAELYAVVSAGEIVVNAQGGRLQRGQNDRRDSTSSGQTVRAQADPRSRRDQSQRRIHKSRLGRDVTRFTEWLDEPAIPARPGENQYPYEPPRTRADKGQDWASRLKACGNGLIPQIAYALALELKQHLEQREAAVSSVKA